MTERRGYDPETFTRRKEYQVVPLVHEAHTWRALDELDTLLRSTTQDDEHRVWYSDTRFIDDDTMLLLGTRHMNVSHTLTQEREIVVAQEDSISSSSRFLIAPLYTIFTSAFVESRIYREGKAAEVIDVLFEEQFQNHMHRFSSRYTFTEYRNGEVDAVVAKSSDVDRKESLEFTMTPYDFSEFWKVLRVVDALRKGVYNGPSESIEADQQ